MILLLSDRVEATVFPCASGDVACLVAAINSANLTAGPHTVQLDGSTFCRPVSVRLGPPVD